MPLQTGSGEAVPNATVSLDLIMPSMAMSPVHVGLKPVQPATTGAYRADGVLSMTGQWVAKVTVTPQGVTAPSVTTFAFTATYEREAQRRETIARRSVRRPFTTAPRSYR